MVSFLVGGFSRGLRNLNRSTVDLADDMHLTGQNTDALVGVMGGLTLLTKKSNDSQGKLSKSIIKNTANYGVNAVSMIQALNAVNDSLEQSIIYGDAAVTSFAETAVTLKAAMAGAEGSDKAIATFLSMAKAIDIGVQTQLGIVDIMTDIRSGNKVNLSEIVAASIKLEKKLGDNHFSLEAITAQYGERYVQSLLMLGRGITKGNELTDEMKAEANAAASTLAAQKAKVDDFYNQLAPGQYNAILKYLPEIAIGIAALPAVMGAAGLAKNAFINAGQGRAGGAGFAPLAKSGLLGKLGKAVGMFGMFAGPVGIGLTALTMGIPLITNYLKGSNRANQVTAEATEELRKQEAKNKESKILKGLAKDTKGIMKQGVKKRSSSAFDATTLSRAAVLASGLLRPGGSRRDRNTIERLLSEQIKATNNVARLIKQIPKSDP